MIDCMLIYPYLEEASWKNELRSKDNLALGYLASSAREEGYTVEIIHAEHKKYSVNDICQLLRKYEPKTVGISCTAQRAYLVSKQYAEAIKKMKNVPVFIGGIFPTIAYKEILQDTNCIDYVSLGEGEIFIKQYLSAIVNNESMSAVKGIAYKDSNGKIIENSPANVIEDLDMLPLPAKDFFKDMERELATGLYYINISAGRGCYGNCSFCSVNKLVNGISKRRVRTPQSVLHEIVHFMNLYKVKYFKFVDELFIDKYNIQWIYDFCQLVKDAGVKFKFHIEARVDSIFEPVIKALVEIGLDEIFIGFESGNLEVLKRYRKGHTPAQAERALEIIRKYNVKIQMGYIMIDPMLTYEQLKGNIEWLLRIGGYSKHNLYNKLNLYYGTDLYHQYRDEKIGKEIKFYERKTDSYIDKRVERFATYIEKAKSRLGTYNIRVNKHILSLIQNGYEWEHISNAINEYEMKMWTNIIEKAICIIDNNEETGWEEFIDIIQDDANRTFECVKDMECI